jgi:transposase
MDEIIQLRTENQLLKQQNRELTARLLVAEGQIKNLTEQLNQNSRNSNWPSSRDKSRKKSKPKSLRQKTDKKTGGQSGHKGYTLKYNPEPDKIEVYHPEKCHHCQAQLGKDDVIVDVTKRQVLDLPPLRFITTEHQAETIKCAGCGQKTSGEFPTDVTNPVQYGTQVKRLAVYLKNEQFIPYERGRQLLTDLFELPISTGTLQNFLEKATKQVEPATEAIKEALIKATVAHADETGFYISGKRVWLHTVSTKELSYFTPHQNRGFKATEEIGVLPEFKGTLIHDAWATYFKYDDMSHALCNVHHLRNLIAIIENDNQWWAKLMKSCLLSAKQLVVDFFQTGESGLPVEYIARINQLYDAIVTLGMAENPLSDESPIKKRGRRKKTKARNLVERFAKRKSMILQFIHDFKVPFDNNLAERDIRMMKVQQKISGCFRSWQGAEQFCSLRSYTSTIRKQGLSVWEALGSLFSGDILMPKLIPV